MNRHTPMPPPGRLQRFQDDFARALLDPDADAGCAPEIAALLSQPGFAVYRNTVMKGCIDALRANYPSVARLVGEEWFRAAASIYARARLPAQPALLHYGAGFEAFLAGFAPAAELPYLPGVARLDRYWTEAHVARDEAPLGAEALAALDAKRMTRLVLHPHASARWAWFDAQPIFTLWQRNRAPDYASEAEIDWRGEGALLARPRGAVAWIGLDAAGCAFLDACAAGGSLAAAGAAALARDPQAGLAALIARLLETGAFGRASLDDQAREAEQP